MASTEVNPKSEKKKMIAAIVLGLGALITLYYAFFGSTSKPATTPATAARNSNSATLAPRAPGSDGSASLIPATMRGDEASAIPPRPIPLEDAPLPAIPEASRNIFAFYVPPPKPVVTPTPMPAPSPAPPPPLQLSSLSPASVYARTSDFKLDVSGDKFTPQTRIYIDGRELETRFISPQQLSATVPAAVIAYEGARQIIVRTADGTIFSNAGVLNVTAPPVPNYTYVGLIGGQRYNDTAILKDKSSKNLVNVQRGDTVAARFRVTSISQREVVLIDSTLRIKHTLPMTTESGTLGGPQRVPQQPVEGEGEEP